MQIPAATAMRAALEGMQRSQERLARDAAYVANAGDLDPAAADSAPAASAPHAGDSPTDMAGAMTDILLAQRAFAAQLRVAETADAMQREVVDLTRPESR